MQSNSRIVLTKDGVWVRVISTLSLPFSASPSLSLFPSVPLSPPPFCVFFLFDCPSDVLLVCPLCRTAEEMFIALGGSIGYWQGNVAHLVDDIGALRPSIFIGVPRVFDRIYSRVTDQVGSLALLQSNLQCGNA